ncbi:hypothetical protein BV25DRAFT_298095 [Artomyces pyxidatus]|uniref:Uncharacterized protein n=1 Tax=Artomyces pyxidatus TaxID=48021 RepID=A0ACB8T7J4_9AGAM|nr:hypothetical protein BV25DRAFT_298095 [Artomyces pyxidatus]
MADNPLSTRIDDNDPSVSYSGGWQNDTQLSIHFTRQVGSSVTVSFHGTQVTAFGSVRPPNVPFNFTIDSAASQSVLSTFNPVQFPPPPTTSTGPTPRSPDASDGSAAAPSASPSTPSGAPNGPGGFPNGPGGFPNGPGGFPNGPGGPPGGPGGPGRPGHGHGPPNEGFFFTSDTLSCAQHTLTLTTTDPQTAMMLDFFDFTSCTGSGDPTTTASSGATSSVDGSSPTGTTIAVPSASVTDGAQNQNSVTSSSHRSHAGLIAGVVVGAILLLLGIVATLLFMRRRQSRGRRALPLGSGFRLRRHKRPSSDFLSPKVLDFDSSLDRGSDATATPPRRPLFSLTTPAPEISQPSPRGMFLLTPAPPVRSQGSPLALSPSMLSPSKLSPSKVSPSALSPMSPGTVRRVSRVPVPRVEEPGSPFEDQAKVDDSQLGYLQDQLPDSKVFQLGPEPKKTRVAADYSPRYQPRNS